MEENELDKAGDGRLFFKVSGASNVHKLSTAITRTFIEKTPFEIHAIGELAVNQAVKSIAKASEQLSGKGHDILVKMFFGDIKHKDKDGSATIICFRLVESK